MTATQAPTPGPLDSESVKLLVKGDLLWAAVHGAPVTVIEAVGASVSYRHSEYAPDGCVIVGKGLEWRAFIGRPDKSGWMSWSGGENPVPGQVVECRWGLGEGVVTRGPSETFNWCAISAPITAFRLAPTAPVEASGSERERIAAAIDPRIAGMDFCNYTPGSWMGQALAAADRVLALRPQPSGETREAVIETILIFPETSDLNAQQAEDLADRILALLSARPLALGGQQGEFLGHLVAPKSGVGTVFVPKGEPVPLVAGRGSVTPVYSGPQNVTTPARAEAQDEGAAGELAILEQAVIDASNGRFPPQGQADDEDALDGLAHLIFKRRKARAHPSPTPAADADRVQKFSLGDRVEKTKGSAWHGRVVGFYSTSLTQIGYAVESEREPGSVQIYPEAALKSAGGA